MENADSTSESGSENRWAQVANKHWLATSKPLKRVQADVLKTEIWDVLENEGFPHAALQTLENLQLLEKYLWPGFTADATNQHVLLIALVINAKRAAQLSTWDIFDRPLDFSSLFRRFLGLSLDTNLPPRIRIELLVTLISAFQSLDNGLVRKECAPLVSIGIWQNLHHDSARNKLLEQNPQFKKAWRAATKRFEAADDETKAKLRFDRSWLYTLLLDFLNILYNPSRLTSDTLLYCERLVEFLTDLQSQFPTRRYVNTLLRDLNLSTAIRLSLVFNHEDGILFRDFYTLFQHYSTFPLDDHTGRQLSQAEISNLHIARLGQLQRTALRYFKEKLQLLALSNYGLLEQRAELKSHLEGMEDDELKDLTSQCGFRIDYPPAAALSVDRNFLLEILLEAHEKVQDYHASIQNLAILPTEASLYDPSLLRNESYDGSRPLAIPKLNLQYLSTGDFLWRSFILFRCEALYEIRKDMEATIKRLQPKGDFASGQTRFGGSSKMAVSISRPAIVEVVPPKVGETVPSQVKTELIFDASRMPEYMRQEWESLKPDDVVFLLAVNASGGDRGSMKESTRSSRPAEPKLQCLRAGEVLYVADENGRPLRQQFDQPNGHHRRPRQRRLIVKLDAAQYQQDMSNVKKGEPDVYENINVVVRRRSRENNFKPMLETIQKLIMSDVSLPQWLQDVFLGLANPESASYKRMPNALQSLDYRDTFLDWSHLLESLPDVSIEPSASLQEKMKPPFVLTREAHKEPAAKPSKKRRREEADEKPAGEVYKVSTYKPLNMGPYPTDEPKWNGLRFTPAQVSAITSGTQPGLTVVVGPPGTGKTDVATQIINNIYHNFPNERTLLIAHSNQALNQLFQKIVALDIDERHLLRLGHGEGELQLDTDVSYSKYGRVESLLESGARLLSEVARLAASIDAPGAHGGSCETADYFNLVYIKPMWNLYWEQTKSPKTSNDQIVENFPFHVYFSNAPQPLFPPDATKEDLLDVARGCYRHVEKLFSELEDIRPFEVLKNARDKANYLLVKEARIIAMTSTHAAIRRQEIANLGFQYENVVMEEAAQITEIENFIPLAMQHPRNGEMPLKRIVLCGDHLQNSPVVQNLAFRQYANLEQSLFLRLVRLGVPPVLLDKQGRARASLAELYSWRYSSLGHLPIIDSSPEFQTANAGLRHDYQFINVPDYKGKGEMEPTPHFIQNLGEAEYAVALFMYMRLLGYAASKISILTMYAGQKALIRDVLGHRCAQNRLFGLPRIVTTVDKYQGEQNDYVILSLTRTSRIGYMRDLRRITVALSRARLGLYIFGRRQVFESCPELEPAFDKLLQRSDKLQLVAGEMVPTKRAVNDDVESTEMEGVEHLGQYVFEITQAKIASLKAGTETLPAPEPGTGLVDEEEDDAEVEGEGEAGSADEDPDNQLEVLATETGPAEMEQHAVLT